MPSTAELKVPGAGKEPAADTENDEEFDEEQR